MKRHRWRKEWKYNICEDCGCRYARGFVSRIYEQPDGSRTARAGECVPRHTQGDKPEGN